MCINQPLIQKLCVHVHVSSCPPPTKKTWYEMGVVAAVITRDLFCSGCFISIQNSGVLFMCWELNSAISQGLRRGYVHLYNLDLFST